MTEEERKFLAKVNIDKAIKKTVSAIIIIVISLLTYLQPTILGNFDSGIIFEIVSFVFLLVGRHYMLEYNESKAKTYIICSMLSAGWIVVYDVIIFFITLGDLIDILFLGYAFYFLESISILYLVILWAIFRDLAKASDPIKYKESTDWFYEEYEKDK